MHDNPVPFLRKGMGATPDQGGCILQVIDWIHRGKWTDHPPCVLPVLGNAAIYANDVSDDEDRQKLLDLAPRLMNTRPDPTFMNNRVLSLRLGAFAARRVLHVFEDAHPVDHRPRLLIEAVEAWCDAPSRGEGAVRSATEEARRSYTAFRKEHGVTGYLLPADALLSAVDLWSATESAVTSAAIASPSSLELLVAMLDEFDRLTDRKSVEAIDWTPVCEAIAAPASA